MQATRLVRPIPTTDMAIALPFYAVTDIAPTLLLLLYFRQIPRTPPRPRHIPTAAMPPPAASVVGAGGGLQGWPDGSPSLNPSSPLKAEPAGAEAVGDRFGAAGVPFDPFKSDSGSLPADFGGVGSWSSSTPSPQRQGDGSRGSTRR